MKKIFSFWRIVISIAWAKSLSWAVTSEKEQRTFFLSLGTIERDNLKALEIILGPLAIVVGIV